MGDTHFVDHPHGTPICRATEALTWIETMRPEAVTCFRCASLLAGVRDVHATTDREAKGEPASSPGTQQG
jgi:hypothetical protein